MLGLTFVLRRDLERGDGRAADSALLRHVDDMFHLSESGVMFKFSVVGEEWPISVGRRLASQYRMKGCLLGLTQPGTS